MIYWASSPVFYPRSGKSSNIYWTNWKTANFLLTFRDIQKVLPDCKRHGLMFSWGINNWKVPADTMHYCLGECPCKDKYVGRTCGQCNDGFGNIR